MVALSELHKPTKANRKIVTTKAGNKETSLRVLMERSEERALNALDSKTHCDFGRAHVHFLTELSDDEDDEVEAVPMEERRRI